MAATKSTNDDIIDDFLIVLLLLLMFICLQAADYSKLDSLNRTIARRFIAHVLLGLLRRI